ncbi:hypothetical protein MSPP1_000886 [Malassezia sp. CBS 17886]|nr:hypothetical protein MSPP1_000886 [Malassezia sp. CBS 17886]
MVALKLLATSVAAGMIAFVSAAPSLAPRTSPGNQVWITSGSDHCLILPKHNMTIGDSEKPGGTKSFCTKPYDSSQGKLHSDFWSEVHYKKTKKYAQLTGCIKPSVQSTLQSDDDGGQYDSNGGDGGKGNPRNSVCIGYAAYVELVEPAAKRACIRCCVDPSDCNVANDEDGCADVIPGRYC